MPNTNPMNTKPLFVASRFHRACSQRKLSLLLALAAFLNFAFAGILQAGNGTWTVIGWNNLGMHCMDDDYSIFSILPPYNTIDSQVIDNNGILVKSGSGVTVTYEGVADPDGSINTTSAGKTNFWAFVQPLYTGNVAVPVNEGLAGNAMPGATNTPQPTAWGSSMNWFEGLGIPIIPIDDQGLPNSYPMMRLVARDALNNVLATTDIVLPVSSEMNCRACHLSTSGTAAMPAGGWVNDPDPKRDYRLNVLRLHDEKFAALPAYIGALAANGYNSAGLYATVVQDGRPILCAQCHSSEALGTASYPGVPSLTQSVHSRHATVINPANGIQMDAATNRSACYQCHPGAVTRCLRGAMGSAVAADGSMEMQCQSCHGTMSQVGASTRTGWFDEPTCQSCHTGDAVSNSGQIRYLSSFDTVTGLMRQPANTRFATNPDAPIAGKSLYRFSKGHGGLACEACHGSTHAEYPSAGRNDNLQSLRLQGHVGKLVDCTACHADKNTITGGPHGMHPVNQAWATGHSDLIEGNGGSAQCQICHGTDYRGTVLSRAQGDRIFSTRFGTKNFWRGYQISCYTCHAGPGNGDQAGPSAPTVANVSISTAINTPASVGLTTSGATVRIVAQPSHGTVALNGKTATYYPDTDYIGPDSFLFAGRDSSNSVDSNLGTATITVGVASTGSLQVTISPPGAVTAGARWKVDNGAWQISGSTLSGLPVGSHTVAFNTVNGWTTPGSQTVSIKSGQGTVVTGTFLVSIFGGGFNFDFTGIVPLWDISGSYAGQIDQGIALDFTILEDSAGKLTGSGKLNVNDGSGNMLKGAATINGTLKSSGTATLVTLTVLSSGTGTAAVGQPPAIHNVTFTSKMTVNAEIDGSNGNLVVTGGSIAAKEIDLVTGQKINKSSKLAPGATLVLPVNVNGNWDVILNLIPNLNKYTGDATIRTSTGRTAPLNVTGSFTAKTGISKINLAGTGCNLNMVLLTSGTNMAVQSGKGKLFGQSLNFTVP